MLSLRPFAAGIAAALICTVAATAQPASDKPSAAHLTERGPSVSQPKKVSKQARPDAEEYSHKVWNGPVHASTGNSVSANTPYGRLTCTIFQTGRRFCAWE